MARSRAVVVAAVAAALLGSVAGGWWLGGAAPAVVPATVVHVVDGDTIVVAFRDGRTGTVRVLGVDTPETVDPRKPVQCFGPEASAYAKAHLAGVSVRLEFDVERHDRYGRLLAYVLVGGDRYEDDLLRRGLARLLVIPPNGAHARVMLAEELEARRARRGLWGAC
jgi:micrococcal nuclease